MSPFDVCVIVPTYNRAGLIGQTLDSILDQTHAPAQVIVVDDGSTDSTEEIVRTFGSRVRYVRIDNGGECRARNVGVSYTSAQWVAFCDSDDLWRRDKLSQHAKLVENAPAIRYMFSNFQTVVDDSWSQATKFDSSPNGYWDLSRRDVSSSSFIAETSMFERLLVHQPIFPSTVVIRRDFFEQIGRWNEPLGRTPSVDLEFHLRCVSEAGIGVISDPVVGIRKHASNFSGDPLKTTIGEIAILQYVLEHNPFAERFARQIGDQIVIRSASAAQKALQVGDIARMRELLSKVPYRRRGWKLHVKAFLAHWPSMANRILNKNSTVMAGSAKPRFVR
jgi:glycosyltransferase involved in cell wall biosynthesis